jgi:glycerophosphoryl diester phosphodiesterase
MTGLLRVTFLVTLLIPAFSPAAEPDRPLIVAHRGLLHHAPENTLSNFRACLELRLGFEFDVMRTKDGELVCIHDDSVDRTTDGTGRVADLTLEEIRRLDAGSWFDPKFAGEKVPTVDEVFRLVAEYREHDVLIAVDLKAAGVEQDVVRLAEKHQVLGKLLFIGRTITEPAVRQNIRDASPKARTAAVANDAEEFAQAVSDTGAGWVYVRFLPSSEQVETARRAGKPIFIAGSTVGGHLPENWKRAAEVGIDAILTDFPMELAKVLRQTAKRE